MTGNRPPPPVVLVIVAAFALAAGADAAPLRSPVYLDAAPVAVAREGTVPLTPADLYDAGRGFGWSATPPGTFDHPGFGGVRTPALCDGVAGADLTLRLSLAPGRWTALAYLDDGFRDAHTVAIEVDGRAVAHNPREFGRESEPDTGPINRYRVALVPIEAAGGVVELRFRQKDPGARLLALHLLPPPAGDSDLAGWLRSQVAEAGRHDSRAALDAIRFELGQHGRKPELAAFCHYWKAHLDLLAEAEHWHRSAGWDWFSAKTRSSMFTRYKIAVALLDPLVEHPEGDAFLIRDRAQWLRTRLLYWIWMEQHIPEDLAALEADVAAMRKRHPDDPLVAMYAGEKVPDPDGLAGLAPHPAAPAWSAAQLEALARMRDIAGYWVDERQIPNGEFGGKTDDDVELLRWWSPLLFTGDARALEGYRKLAEGVWHSPRMHLGYSREPRDVEHSSEFIADTVPVLALVTRDPEWIGRLGWSWRHMRDLWTGRNEHGDLVFKSAWIGATEILMEPPRNRDLGMNTRAAKAVRYHAWLTGDPAAGALLRDWGLAWAKAAARTDKGKPRGLFPASLRWPDAAFNGDEPGWHKANMFWRYFDWGGDGDFYDQLLFSWLGTRDDRLLEPLHDTLALLARHRDPASRRDQPEGSAGWAAGLLWESAEFWGAVAHWRLESGDARHDALLIAHGPPYLRYRLTGDPAGIAEGIHATLLDVLRYNRPMLTTEVLFTDRVYVSRDKGNIDGADLLTAMLTGCHASDGVSPYFHVAWDDTPPGFTALVSSTGADHVAADVFLHQAAAGRITARFLRLAPGNYKLTVTAAGRPVSERTEKIAGPDHRVRLDLPGGALVTVRLARAGER